MPELPEVETMRRGIRGCIGQRIQAVERPRCRLKPIAFTPSLVAIRRRMVGATITATVRAGKRVVIQLDSDDALVLEPRMTGLVLVTDPPDREHLRLRLRLSADPDRQRSTKRAADRLLFWDRRGLGTVRLYSPLQYVEALGPSRLGPDALVIDDETLIDRLGSSRRAIKVALLDQTAIAGIGNIYAAEILHVAKVHPQAACRRLRPTDWQQIVEATRQVLVEAIRHEGSTLGDGTYRTALNRKGRYQHRHRVYDRLGDRCDVCQRGYIQRIVQCQRSTFFCPVCQRKRRQA